MDKQKGKGKGKGKGVGNRILWLNPVGNSLFDKPILDILVQNASKETSFIEVASLTEEGRPKHLEHHSYEAIIGSDLMKVVKHIHTDFDCIVIGCFYDSFLGCVKEVAGNSIVTAPCISCCSIAKQLGNTFSVIVGHNKWIPKMKGNIHKYGFGSNLSSFRSLNLGVEEFQTDPKETKKRIIEQSKKAVEEDGAEVIILGCTIEFGFYEKVQEEVGVPVIDAVIAPFKYAEMLSECKNKFNWINSNVGGSKKPNPKEEEKWKLYNGKPPIGNKVSAKINQ